MSFLCRNQSDVRWTTVVVLRSGPDVPDNLEQPVESCIEEYRGYLEGHGRAAKHISETIRHIRNTLQESGCVVLRDLQCGNAPIEKYLAARHKSGVSHRTVNADLVSIRAFCRWLIEKRHLTADPTLGLKKLNQAVDRRKERRPLTDEEARCLIQTTLASKRVFRGLSGQDRAILYMLAQRTGLRRNELCSLTPRSFVLDANPPTVSVEALKSKNRQKAILPLPSEVAKELTTYLKGRRRSEAIWSGRWWEKSGRMFRQDLGDAGIDVVDENGRVLDFHGQRVTFISGLARAGVSPTKAQKLARHSDVNLTLATYTHLQVEELAGAVEGLPSLNPANSPGAPNSNTCPGPPDAELDQVVKAWPALSQDVRRAIAKIIDESVEG